MIRQWVNNSLRAFNIDKEGKFFSVATSVRVTIYTVSANWILTHLKNLYHALIKFNSTLSVIFKFLKKFLKLVF